MSSKAGNPLKSSVMCLVANPSVRIFESGLILLLGSIATRIGCRSVSTSLTVSAGSSRITVLAPTSTAQQSFRSSCTCLRHSSLVNLPASLDRSSTEPFASIATFTVTYGLRFSHQCKNSRICSAASSSRRPHSTLIPASSKTETPFPLTNGFGSPCAITTSLIPAQSSASVHGGVLPKWLQGSNVMYALAPLVLWPFSSASCIAICSACSPPKWSCQPSAITIPSLTKTQPTKGFGRTCPLPFSATSRARLMYSRSAALQVMLLAD